MRNAHYRASLGRMGTGAKLTVDIDERGKTHCSRVSGP